MMITIPAVTGRKVQRPTSERVMMVVITIFMVLFCFCTLYPFINTLAISFNEGPDTLRGGIYFVPRIFTWQNYEEIFSDSSILSAYTITILRTVFTLMFTGLLAYGLSKKYLRGRRAYMILCTFAMIFNAGLIPTYMLYRDVKLINNFWVYILPSAVNIWDMILMKNFFEQLPEEVEESAEIDGAATVIITILPIIFIYCLFQKHFIKGVMVGSLKG